MESFRKVRFLIILIIGVKKNRVTLRDHVIPTKYLGAIRKVDFCLAKRWCCLRFDYPKKENGRVRSSPLSEAAVG